MLTKISSSAGELQLQHICLMGNLGETPVVFQQLGFVQGLVNAHKDVHQAWLALQGL